MIILFNALLGQEDLLLWYMYFKIASVQQTNALFWHHITSTSGLLDRTKNEQEAHAHTL